LFSLIIISSYTANLAAVLTVENIIIPINDVHDLAYHPTIKFGTINSGTSRSFFEVVSKSTFNVNLFKLIKFIQRNALSIHVAVLAADKACCHFLLSA